MKTTFIRRPPGVSGSGLAKWRKCWLTWRLIDFHNFMANHSANEILV